MGIIQKINNLLAKKQKIEKEIAILQKSCKHNNQVIKSIKENEDSSNSVIRCVCDDCNKILRVPSQSEIFKFLSE